MVVLRQSLELSLDDLLSVVHEFIHPTMLRSSLHRLLQRRGLSRRPQPERAPVSYKAFKAYEPGFVHVDVKYLPATHDTPPQYAFVAIERATRWVFLRVYSAKSAQNARSFLNEVVQAAPFKITHLLTDNGTEFTDRFLTRGASPSPSGNHAFDILCQSLGIEHRLTPVRRPQTNAMVERFNGRIAQILRTHHVRSGEELSETLTRYVHVYNHHLPQNALGHLAPCDALRKWQRSHPHLFHNQKFNCQGHDRPYY